MHPSHKVEMIPHKGETKHIHTIQSTQSLDQSKQIVLVHIPNGQTLQGCSGYDMIDRAFGISDKSGYAGHDIPPW
jgi:hypothetical protein